MPQYLSPGVYVEEKQAGVRPIEGVGTAVAAFVGFAAQGPYTPQLVTNWSQFTSTFGDFLPGSYLAHAVYGFFNNGGGACYVVRIGGDEGNTPAKGLLTAGHNGSTTPAFKVAALEKGTAGNDLTIEIEPAGRIELEPAPEEPTPTPAATSGSATTPDGPDDKAEAGTPASAAESGKGATSTQTPPKTQARTAPAAAQVFDLRVMRGPKVLESFEGLRAIRGTGSAVEVVNRESRFIQIEEAASTGNLPALVPSRAVLTGGSSTVPSKVAAGEYGGQLADRTGFAGLEAIPDVTMVVVPDLMAAYQRKQINDEQLKGIQLAMISHCEKMANRIAIIDPPPNLNAQQIKEWRLNTAGYDSRFAALYWPWIKVMNPSTGQPEVVPPSGAITGIWGRNDDERGVHKAPANEVVRGAIDVELNITKEEHDQLNPHGINAIRFFPGRGVRVWGARTLSSDPAWRYINVRRYFNYLQDSILNGTQWCVFEPNDYDLWSRMRRTVDAFLTLEWRKGALFGQTTDEAFYVKCDRETNPDDVIDAGMVVCEIGVCPVKPAEFVVFRLSQFSAGSTNN